MTKSGLGARLAAKDPHLYRQDAERIVSTIFREIGDALDRGERIELRGFGAFAIRRRGMRTRRNPRTGVVVHVPQKAVPYFRTGKDLRAQLNA